MSQSIALQQLQHARFYGCDLFYRSRMQNWVHRKTFGTLRSNTCLFRNVYALFLLEYREKERWHRVKSIEEREYLFDIDAGARGILAKYGRSDELDLIFKSYSNLLRVLGD